jgi:hypothetical protein
MESHHGYPLDMLDQTQQQESSWVIGFEVKQHLGIQVNFNYYNINYIKEICGCLRSGRPKKDEVTGGRKNLRDEKLHDFNCSPSIIVVSK